jgi:hypothetical protein
MLPVLVVVIVFLKKSELHDPMLENRIGSLYENVKIEKKSALLVNGIFLFRRLLFTGAIVFLHDHPYLQV